MIHITHSRTSPPGTKLFPRKALPAGYNGNTRTEPMTTANTLRFFLSSTSFPLIQTAFSVKNPYIVLNSLRTTSEQNQQNGLKEIILGLIHMVRNVTAHELRIRWDINENDAIDILQQVSFVHKYMDQCIPVRHLT